ncbi:MAG: hypothetical protein WD512_20215 [Candidatus Paceibacterota bacterium]
MKISNRNPEPFLYDNPIGLNQACQAIQIKLRDNISWIQKSFGRAYKIHRESPDKKSMERPHAYARNGEYYELMPNDSLKAFSFMAPISKGEYIDYAENSPSQLINRNIALIVWGNLKKIDPSKDEVFTDELIQDITKILKKIPYVNNILNIEDEDITAIFKPFSTDKFHQALFYPYFSLRFEIELTYYLEEC